jgi:probable phosphoglycerate mutase
MPTRVFLLRHAESADPTVFHGYESDVDLSVTGRRQADVVARVLAPEKPDVVVSSNMLRARQTALPLARACGLALTIVPELHERKIGILSGKPWSTEPIWPATLERWSGGDTAYAPEGAESYDDIQKRILPAWEKLMADHAGKTLVVVAHGIVCRILLLSILPGHSAADWNKIGTPNIGISELVKEGETWQALYIGRQPEGNRP